MAVTGIQPFIKVLDNNGQPIVGAKLYVYEVGTTTERAIYSDADLTTPFDNPLEGDNASNANGDFPKFYMAEGEYKLRAVTSADVLIWEEDDLDTGMSAGSGALPISRGGTGATTAAAARAALDVPSTSELSDLADDLSDIQTIVQAVVSQPIGRLSLTTGVKKLVSDVSAGTAVYLTGGYAYPVWDGAQFATRTSSSDLTLTLNANHVANGIYDNFVIWDNSALVHVTGVIWNTVTAGSGARGTGAGTTELELVNGLLVNKYAQTMRNGATTYSVAARAALYVGSTPIDGSNGQCSEHVTYGQSRRPGPWSAFSRLRKVMKAGDATASWTYNTNTVRAANNSSANSLTVFSGLPEECFTFRAMAYRGGTTSTNQSVQGSVGVGFNSTSAFSGLVGQIDFTNSTASNIVHSDTIIGSYTAVPAIGLQTVTLCEQGGAGTAGTVTWSGTETHSLLTAEWMS